MILGMGTDLCMISRIEQSVERFGDRFLKRVFTETERTHADRLSGAARMGSYAKRWAAKEACAKALGTGFAEGVQLQDIGICNGPSGAPELRLSGGAQKALQRLTPAGQDTQLLVSLTDDPPFALAQVIIQSVPPGSTAPIEALANAVKLR
ncbi:holo-ACP synthase [Gluconobacter roseus]|uniref:Holo-[acyl-carrier-protein] synthase n=1 Tax=Gluconobacter roseus NBRC 3990 TaxID=1307950 RepID=A0A4Y3M2W6_9PROT|nr:holo-ACP synthase [Gluconobacter roseus]KXV44160.1 4'-phosphopantetheinyl transferase [Gluconobacter roseus]GBR45336.1 holo-ACP synthase [Gluconobacter roseus NBRC 3990]GEB02933.1 holo-[acyl-carrier-protein] synthase [Gluconobacter roseus NBRC 3990]GLP93392.1 holo-[acyl-carrier-protein] synthase [Gluconobacter roseus NBRC 3990]